MNCDFNRFINEEDTANILKNCRSCIVLEILSVPQEGTLVLVIFSRIDYILFSKVSVVISVSIRVLLTGNKLLSHKLAFPSLD